MPQPIVKPANPTPLETKIEELIVEGMGCEDCERRIQRTLKELTGVVSVEASHETGIVKVKYHPSMISLAKIEHEFGLDELEGYCVVKTQPPYEAQNK